MVSSEFLNGGVRCKFCGRPTLVTATPQPRRWRKGTPKRMSLHDRRDRQLNQVRVVNISFANSLVAGAQIAYR